MRILLTIHHDLDPNSGAPGVTLQLAGALEAAGHQTRIFSWDDLPARLDPRARELLFPAFAAGRMMRAAAAGVDIVDAATGDGWIWSILRRGAGPALVTRSHGLEHTFWDARRAQARSDGETIPTVERVYHGGLRLWESGLSLRRADAALFLNRGDRDRAVRELGVRPDHAHIVANGVAVPFLAVPPPRPAGDGPLRLAQIGSWAPRKGAAVICAALGAQLAQGHVTLTLFGGGVPAEQVLQMFPPSARDAVHVVPRFEQSRLPIELAAHDALLLPSFAEGSSVALLEAMACGVAPVATTVGAAPDVIRDGIDGLLIGPGDAGALAAAVSRLVQDRPLVQRLRENAHRAARRFSWERVAADTVALYGRVRTARP